MQNEAKKILLLVVALTFANSCWAQGADGNSHKRTSLRKPPLLREALEITEQAGWIPWGDSFTVKIDEISQKIYVFDLTADLIPYITDFDDLPWILNHPKISDSQKDALVVRAIELNQVIASEWLHLAWQEETKSAAMTKSSSCNLLRIFVCGAMCGAMCGAIERKNNEPAYLEKISQLLAPRLAKIAMEKEAECLAAGGDAKVVLTRHAYSLLFSMGGYWEVAWYAAWDSTLDDALGSAWDSAFDAAWYDALRAARDAARNAASDVARSAAIDAAWSAAFDPASEVARSAALRVAWGAVIDALNTSATEWQAAARLAHRVAEKVVLLYFLVNFERIFHEIYNAGYEKLTSLPANNIFESRESWEAFKEEHFGSLREDALHFVQPWRRQLDGVAKSIAKL